MAPPTSASEVRSLLGMSNYLSRFIPDYATITEPLRMLTHDKGSEWEWSDRQTAALEQLKHSLISAPVVSYFDPNKDIEIITDASPVGIGAVLTQISRGPNNSINRNVVAYASRSLTDTEQRYSQTEREALAIVWACVRFHLYTYGASFKVITDHKPLVPMLNNPRAKLPARIERWQLRLQPYSMKVEYRPGQDNPADFLSS